MNEQQGPPHPYLTRDETNDILETLNFSFTDSGTIMAERPQTRLKIQALERLIAGAIAEWADIELEPQMSWAAVEAELTEWAEEWLFG